MIPKTIVYSYGWSLEFIITLQALEDEFDKHRRRFRREPISLTLAVILGLRVAAGVGTGTAALIQTPQYFHELRSAIDEDLRAIEQSIF